MRMNRWSVLFKNLHILAILMPVCVVEMPVQGFPGLNWVIWGVWGTGL